MPMPAVQERSDLCTIHIVVELAEDNVYSELHKMRKSNEAFDQSKSQPKSNRVRAQEDRERNASRRGESRSWQPERRSSRKEALAIQRGHGLGRSFLQWYSASNHCLFRVLAAANVERWSWCSLGDHHLNHK
ncbi:hypothetical protein C8R44DRAFT_188944 [Mycena epipterygia]|nr:hypothetical protein C8R44DRAFT_188944 [Mycena epipterygia]